jgi:hypothetical protein
MNGRPAPVEEMRAFLSAAADAPSREASGGFLFRAHIGESRVFLGVVPAYRDTRRYYHHDITLGTEDWPILTGEFQVEGAVRLLCPPESGREYSDGELPLVRGQLAAFADLVIGLGYPGDAPLDWLTVKWLGDSGIRSDSPRVLASLSSAS